MQNQVQSMIHFICTHIHIQIFPSLREWRNPFQYNRELSSHPGEALSRKSAALRMDSDCSRPALPSCHPATRAPDPNHHAYASPYVSSLWASLGSSSGPISTFPSFSFNSTRYISLITPLTAPQENCHFWEWMVLPGTCEGCHSLTIYARTLFLTAFSSHLSSQKNHCFSLLFKLESRLKFFAILPFSSELRFSE